MLDVDKEMGGSAHRIAHIHNEIQWIELFFWVASVWILCPYQGHSFELLKKLKDLLKV